MYTIAHYGNMIADRVRMGGYLAAMERTIRPGSVVVDVGCGPGILALHACRLGAARVYAIEPDDSIGVAIALARANGVAERIRFFQEPAENVRLPEQADVIVSDLHGTMPMQGAHFRAIAHARRWLKPGGRLLPMADVLRCALVTHPAWFESVTSVWAPGIPGADLSAARRWRLNLPERMGLKPEVVAVQPAEWARLDYMTLDADGVAGAAQWHDLSPATLHAAALWFDCELAPGIGFSNAPGPDAGIYGQLLLPLLEPLTVRAGDAVRLEIKATRRGEDYGWRWVTEHRAAGGEMRARLVQDSFLGKPIGPATLRQLADGAPPPQPPAGGPASG